MSAEVVGAGQPNPTYVNRLVLMCWYWVLGCEGWVGLG